LRQAGGAKARRIVIIVRYKIGGNMAEKKKLAQPISAAIRRSRDNDAGQPGEPRFRVDTSLTRAEQVLTSDHVLWAAIRNRTEAIGSNSYADFIARVLGQGDPIGDPVCDPCEDDNAEASTGKRRRKIENRLDLLALPGHYGVDAYNLLKVATQAFLLFETGVAVRPPRGSAPGAEGEEVPGEESRTGEAITFEDLEDKLTTFLERTLSGGLGSRGLPYLKRIVLALLGTEEPPEGCPYTFDVLENRFTCPSMLELIWSYWHEEGMLVQTMNAICMRFQNRRGPLERDPLANLEIDPLRPLNNLLWGYIQDEYNRLTVPRRAYEYDHHYGLKLMGKAVPELRSADSRSKFIEAFHNLLYRTAGFYREDADTTVIADGFSLLSSLREVHLLLAEGAHNQFGDLPWTARAEMLMMEWMLARPEMREFLRGRVMVPYQETWMGQVDSMKKLQGWTDTSVTHFRNLGVFGEQILLAIRYGDWMNITDQNSAKTWARYWRPEIQGYIHAYLAATGIDLTEDIVDTRGAPARYLQPSILLRDRTLAQGTSGALSSGSATGSLGAGNIGFGALAGARRRALNPARKI
jgi:hypothetical protein